ncbi:MAG: SAM-dependent methyltransferase [Candidatus Sungbacteria bacterium]|uniref:SAM-dependent methyltransferase n=1 Tax=Candidatus Sungiibacteriota bacterium TaxID=2750080 RepID=A0A932YVU9_9BACT|nr:SAM-dependent methyltransferase [Candidatus Sungbacteria bacterium]
MPHQRVAGSFRDPSGFVFWREGTLYRQVNVVYRAHYEELMRSGLFKELARAGMLVNHEEAAVAPESAVSAYKIIKPELAEFVSYPYEWSFSQLQDAALLTLAIQKRALAFGMSLKDASAFNVQFKGGRPILIDTLSFEPYREGRPWAAYRQFCQHFLAPLALMAFKDVRLNQVFRIFLDGIPLDLASALLPFRARFHASLFLHVFLHSRSQKYFSGRPIRSEKSAVSRAALLGMVESLESAVKRCSWRPHGTEWADYYDMTNYSPGALEQKKRIVDEFVSKIGPGTIWDLGANTGLFSRIAARPGVFVVAIDYDPAAVEKNYLETVSKNETRILPLVMDLLNPSPAVGWGHEERMSLQERGPADMLLALALVHHLAIANNLPFLHIAEFFRRLSPALIIEFVPKEDSQVQKLLAGREDIFADYTAGAFEAAFRKHFVIRERRNLESSGRVLYLMTQP